MLWSQKDIVDMCGRNHSSFYVFFSIVIVCANLFSLHFLYSSSFPLLFLQCTVLDRILITFEDNELFHPNLMIWIYFTFHFKKYLVENFPKSITNKNENLIIFELILTFSIETISPWPIYLKIGYLRCSDFCKFEKLTHTLFLLRPPRTVNSI